MTYRYAPAVRLAQVRMLVSRPNGATFAELQEEIGISWRTAHRMIRALENAGELIIVDQDEGSTNNRKRYTIPYASAGDIVRDVRRALGLRTTEELVSVLRSFLESRPFGREVRDESVSELRV